MAPSGTSPSLYAGADLRRAQRFGAVAWAFGLLLLGVLAVDAPPTAHGDLGWAVLAAAAVALLALVAVSAAGRIGFGGMLAVQHLAVVAAAVLQWCSGGWDASYLQVFAALAVFVSAVHPRRRALPPVALCLAAALLPGAYGPRGAWGSDMLLGLLLWVGIAAFVGELMTTVRAQRLELARAGELARHDARRDPLTGLPNRRALAEQLDREVVGRFAVAVGDLDRFKEVNDRFGHAAGDDCLRQVGAALRAATRGSDTVYRWGGDEFVVLLHDVADSSAACERMAAAVSTRVRMPDGEPVRVSFGVVEDDGASSFDELLAGADRALLARKRSRSSLA